MILYHITDKDYQPGQIVNVRDFDGDSIYHQSLQASQKIINEYLSAHRPVGQPSRQLCIYAFEKPEYCVYFRKEIVIAEHSMNLYRCEMNSPQGHPMILVNQFEVISDDKWEQLSNEYWYPTKRWNLMEHMAEEMHVLEAIPITNTFINSSKMIGNNDYADDFINANNFFNFGC